MRDQPPEVIDAAPPIARFPAPAIDLRTVRPSRPPHALAESPAESPAPESSALESAAPESAVPESPAAPAPGRFDGWLSAAPPSGVVTVPEELAGNTDDAATASDAVQMERRAVALLAGGSSADVAEAVALLRRALGLEPWRLSLGRRLMEAAPRAGDTIATQLARSLFALVDEAIPRPPSLITPTTPLEQLLHDPEWEGPRALWRRVWEQALPLFRESLPPGVGDNDRVTRVATTELARAFRDALEALRETELPAFYVDRGGAPELRVVRTPTPSLLAGAGYAADEDALRFALGHALELARPEHVLVATLPPARARALIEAVQAAFGPADDNEGVSREAAALASELWRTIPTRGQNELREMLASTDRFDDYEGMRASVADAATRAGLLSCGDLGVALECAAGAPLADPGALTRALTDLPHVTSLARFAFESLR